MLFEPFRSKPTNLQRDRVEEVAVEVLKLIVISSHLCKWVVFFHFIRNDFEIKS